MIIEDERETENATIFMYENGDIHISRQGGTFASVSAEEASEIYNLIEENNV